MVTGGQLRSFSHVWENYTSDRFILSTVSGYEIEFEYDAPYQALYDMPQPYKLNEQEIEATDSEILTLLQKGVIGHTEIEPGQYVSNVFTRPKKKMAATA